MQLPVFPAGSVEINGAIGVQKEAGVVWYLHGHLPLFHHGERDGKTQRDREGVWRADDYREAVREAVPGPWDQGVLRGQATPQFGVGANRGSDGAGAAIIR